MALIGVSPSVRKFPWGGNTNGESMYLHIDDYDQFFGLTDFARKKVSAKLIKAVRNFHEAKELEELFMNSLGL